MDYLEEFRKHATSGFIRVEDLVRLIPKSEYDDILIDFIRRCINPINFEISYSDRSIHLYSEFKSEDNLGDYRDHLEIKFKKSASGEDIIDNIIHDYESFENECGDSFDDFDKSFNN